MHNELFFASSKNEAVVGRSLEFLRILDLPRRDSFPDIRKEMSEMLRLPGVIEQDAERLNVPFELRFHQAWMLAECAELKGVIGNLGVGTGKTLVSFLIPTVVEAQRPVLLVPGGLLHKTNKEFRRLADIWTAHPNLRVLSYQAISRKNGEDLLGRIMPDCIIADECHYLKNTGASCTRKVKRWMEAYPETMFFGFSGTIVTRSLNDVAHMMWWALRDQSPLPHTLSDRLAWALATDVGVPEERRPDPGALHEFCRNDESIRLGLRRRIIESPGIITTESPLVQKSDGTDIALNIYESSIVVDSPALRDAMTRLRATETLEDEVLLNALEVAAKAKELAYGFYYRWVWPGGKRDKEWIDCRAAWRKFVRKVIRHGANINGVPTIFDSEEPVKDAVIAGQLECPNDEWNKWKAVEGRYKIETEAVWVDDSVVDKIAAWIKDHPKGGIVWLKSEALLRRVKEKYPKIPCFLAGENDIDALPHDSPSCVASLAHRTGKNLQFAFSKNLIVELPDTGRDWEQLLGRTHRSGQIEDEVEVWVLLHTIDLWETFQKARREARYYQDQWNSVQRLNYATIDVSEEDDVLAKVQQIPQNPLWLKRWLVED